MISCHTCGFTHGLTDGHCPVCGVRVRRNRLVIHKIRHAPGRLPTEDFPNRVDWQFDERKTLDEIIKLSRSDPNAQPFTICLWTGRESVVREDDVGLWIDDGLYTPSLSKIVILNESPSPRFITRISIEVTFNTLIGEVTRDVTVPIHTSERGRLTLWPDSSMQIKLRQPIIQSTERVS